MTTDTSTEAVEALMAWLPSRPWRYYLGDICNQDGDVVLAGVGASYGSRQSTYSRMSARTPAARAFGNFVAASPALVSALVAERNAIAAERDALREALKEIADAFGCECGEAARAALGDPS